MGEKLAELGVNLPVLIAQVVSFVLLFILLRQFAYKPILRMLDERSRRIRESIEQTETIKEQAARAEQESKQRIEAGIREGQELIAKAARAGEEVRQQAQQKAQDEATALVARAREEIQRERDEAIGSVRKEFADLTIMAAEKVIDRSLDRNAHRDVIDKVLDEAQTLKRG
jgi:F-type H+-transporting ATPase subunit b